jgi:hypothetical protein
MKKTTGDLVEASQSTAAHSHGLLRNGAVLCSIILGVVGAVTSPSGAETITNSFEHRVEAVCAANVHSYPPIGHFPYDHFDPRHPPASQLPEVGRFFTKNQRGIQPLEAALTRLGDPPRGGTEWHRVRVLAFSILENEKAQRDAALAGNVHRFVGTVNRGDRLVHRLSTAARHAGFSVTGACSKIFQ